jgi:hypothetical protein
LLVEGLALRSVKCAQAGAILTESGEDPVYSFGGFDFSGSGPRPDAASAPDAPDTPGRKMLSPYAQLGEAAAGAL